MLVLITMQKIFYTSVSPEEYHRLGKDFPFPVPDFCPHCLVKIAPQKHGFYQRNIITGNFQGRILIRRYHCKYCGKTVSYLPSFCLPYFQYTVEVIYTALWYILVFCYSLRTSLQLLKGLFWAPAHLQFYTRRFLANLNRIKLGLRQLLPRVELPGENLGKREGAKKVLHIVAAGFARIQTFSTRFSAQCGYSFLAPCT